MIVTVPVINLSICQCGYPLFDEKVKEGDVYEMDNAMTHNGTVECGGCGISNPSKFIWVFGNINQPAFRSMPGWMPSEAFDL